MIKIRIHDIEWTDDPLLNAYILQKTVRPGEGVRTLHYEPNYTIVQVAMPCVDPRGPLDLGIEPNLLTEDFVSGSFARRWILDENGKRVTIWVREY